MRLVTSNPGVRPRTSEHRPQGGHPLTDGWTKGPNQGAPPRIGSGRGRADGAARHAASAAWAGGSALAAGSGPCPSRSGRPTSPPDADPRPAHRRRARRHCSSRSGQDPGGRTREGGAARPRGPDQAHAVRGEADQALSEARTQAEQSAKEAQAHTATARQNGEKIVTDARAQAAEVAKAARASADELQRLARQRYDEEVGKQPGEPAVT